MEKTKTRGSHRNFISWLAMALVILPSWLIAQDQSGAFSDHGVASPVSNHRGIVATVDGRGRNVVLIWLFDHRGGYALLMVDADTGKSEEFPVSFDPQKDTPYASILSRKNRYYTLFNGHFLEFDPVKRAFTFQKTTLPKMAMAMTEDDRGVIWAVTYPNSGVVSFDPETRELRDYGYVYDQNWRQYQRSVAADDTGWIYFAVGNTASQIVAFDPTRGTARPLLSEDERKRGMSYVYRDLNGKVYGQASRDADETWYELYRGERRTLARHDSINPKNIITGNQGLFHPVFPDGRLLKNCDLIERTLAVEDPETKDLRQVSFDYSSEGAWVMGVAVSPDGRVSGGTTFPMRYFSYDPESNTWMNERAFGQFNALASDGRKFFFGVYPGGSLLEWDPSQPWTGTRKDGPSDNPRFLASGPPSVYRPHRLLVHNDNRTLIMSGTPDYGYTGGGLLIWDRKSETATVLKDSDVIHDQSTMSMVSLADGTVLGGTTTAPGSGGEKKALEAVVYKLDLRSKSLVSHKRLILGAEEYSDLCTGTKGLIYGVADKKVFFVFDPVKEIVVHSEDAGARFGISTGEQSPRIFVRTKEGGIYLLFKKGIVQLDESSFALRMIAEAPVAIDAGGDYFDGRIYFVSGSHIWSYDFNQ